MATELFFVCSSFKEADEYFISPDTYLGDLYNKSYVGEGLQRELPKNLVKRVELTIPFMFQKV